MSISLLIDGYNVLHATGALKVMRGPAALAKARDRMLSQIAGALTESQRRTTEIVFDARRSGAANGLDSQVIVRGMTVTFAIEYYEADDLLEQIIRQHPQPRTLTVISSDLRVQRSAKARKAQVFGSDQWLTQLLDGQQLASASAPTSAPTEDPESIDPTPKLTPDEVAQWLKEFGW